MNCSDGLAIALRLASRSRNVPTLFPCRRPRRQSTICKGGNHPMPDHLLEESLTHPKVVEDSAHLRFPGSVMARFMELRGRHIVRACGAVWYAVPGRFLMSLPYQAMLNPEPAELRRLIRETGAWGVRFPSMQ